MPNQFVILEHQQADGTHYDFMLELPDVLATWTFQINPLAGSVPLSCERLPDHRKAYLTYEGPISNNRGEVHRVAEGELILHQSSEQAWRFTLIHNGKDTHYVLNRESESIWNLDKDSSTNHG